MSFYGLIIGISIVIGVDYFSKHQKTLSPKQLNIFTTGTIISAILGARLYHVIDKWSFYSQAPYLIPQTWNGGLGIYGGIIGSFIFILLFLQITKKPLLPTLDSISPILPLCQSIGRLGNYANHEISTWWIEAGLNLFLFLFIKKFPQKPTAKYFIGYGLIRFFYEFFRNDTWTINSLKIAQIISLSFIVIGTTLLFRKSSSKLD